MTNLPDTTFLVTELDKGWLTVWLNRPDVKNAMSRALTDELQAVLAAIHPQLLQDLQDLTKFLQIG